MIGGSLHEGKEMNDLVLFESSDGAVTMQVQTDRETVWLNRAQLAELFGRDNSLINSIL